MREDDGLTVSERVFIKMLHKRGYAPAEVREILLEYFEYDVSQNVIYRTLYAWRMEGISGEELTTAMSQAEVFIVELEKVMLYTRLDEVEKTRRMRLEVDSRIKERIQKSDDIRLGELTPLSKYLFEREQLLAGKPTSITKSYKELTDDELLIELKKLNVIEGEAIKSPIGEADGGESDREGVKAAEGGGEDSVLEAAPEATSIRAE